MVIFFFSAMILYDSSGNIEKICMITGKLSWRPAQEVFA